MRRVAAIGTAGAVLVATVMWVMAATASPPVAAATAPPPVGSVVSGSMPGGAAAFLGPARQVRVGSVKLGYRQFGKGPDLFVISGFASPMSLWGTQLPKLLAQHHRVTMFDNRGIGYSTDDVAQPETIPLLASDAAGLIRTLRLRTPSVLGWSMGGQIALTLAVKYPGIARRVVLTGADFGGTHAVLPDAATVAILNNPDTTPQQFLNLLFPTTAGQAEQAFVEQLALVPQEATPASATARQGNAEGAWYRYEGTYKSLPSVKVPVVVTNGALDVVNPVANAKLIAKRLPRASVVIFAAAGHAMLFQNAPRFAALVNG